MKKKPARKVQNQRRYSRVNTYLPIAVRRVEAKPAAELKSRVEQDPIIVDFTTPPSLDNASLAEVLSRLDSKLSAILSLLVPEQRGFTALSFRVMNLSANGMRFSSPEPFDLGELLELKLVLYGRPHVLLTIHGKVTRSVEQKQGFNISIRFVSETEEVRDAFLRYDFAEHRSFLRHIVEKGSRDANLLLVNR
ncbi:MAG: PilZ domain-containing protein [Syntrophaceae bacterium]|nr:PilZ domain-containing protein [Syntrophaceae bacterium]